jgi:hypothetical protein
MAQQHPSEIQVSEPCNPVDLLLQLSGNTEDSPTRNKRPHSDAPITESLEQEVSPHKKMATTQALQDDGEIALPLAPTDGTQSAPEGASTFLGLLPPAPCPTPADPAEITILQLQEEVSRLSELKERIEKEVRLMFSLCNSLFCTTLANLHAFLCSPPSLLSRLPLHSITPCRNNWISRCFR